MLSLYLFIFMKHISKLILNNFQQWKTGLIEFKPGLNILIGNTESGKSTLFRAIGSILTGKMPEDYIRKGTKGCEVEIQFSDNTIFKRSRNKKDNIANANGVIFERVGKEIPFEYFNKLGKTSIEFGSKELSLCSYSQFEPHFFITLSDYDKSKLIGTICGIDIVDRLMDLINKDIRSNNTNIKFLETQISEQKAEKSVKVPEFEAVNKKMSEMTECYGMLDDKFKMVENLSELSNKLISLNNNINISKIEKNTLELKIGEFNRDKVELLQKLHAFKKNLGTLIAEIDMNKYLQLRLVLKGVDVNKVNLLDDLMFLREKLQQINDQINSCLEDNHKVSVILSNYENQKKDLLKDFDKCPLCGGAING